MVDAEVVGGGSVVEEFVKDTLFESPEFAVTVTFFVSVFDVVEAVVATGAEDVGTGTAAVVVTGPEDLFVPLNFEDSTFVMLTFKRYRCELKEFICLLQLILLSLIVENRLSIRSIKVI